MTRRGKVRPARGGGAAGSGVGGSGANQGPDGGARGGGGASGSLLTQTSLVRRHFTTEMDILLQAEMSALRCLPIHPILL